MRHAERSVFSTAHETSRSNYDFSGRWKNELGSILDIRVRDGVITGTYVSAVSDAGGPTPPFPVTGTVTEDLLVFIVNWGGLITTWCGHHVDADGTAQILTLWYLVKTVADETNPQNQWKMIEAGSDVFVRA